MKVVETDLVVPVQIEHKVEEMWDGDALVQHYNYIEYHFESAQAYCRARAYFDDLTSVALFGPFKSRAILEPVTDGGLADGVVSYLSRRFDKIERR